MEYYVSFDTKKIKGSIVATKTAIDSVLISDLEKKLDLGLCDDPLYSDLVDYMVANGLPQC